MFRFDLENLCAANKSTKPVVNSPKLINVDGVITMDTKSPYSGDHSPLIKLDAREPHGLSQSGIAVRKGKA